MEQQAELVNPTLVVGASTFVAVFLVYNVLFKDRSGRKYPPSLPHIPILGSLPFVPESGQLHVHFLSKMKEYGSVFGLYSGSRYAVVLNGRDAIREALGRKATDFAGRYLVVVEEQVWNKDLRGIIFRQWSEDYKKIKQLTVSILKQFGYGHQGIMDARIQAEADALIKHIEEKNGDAFDTEDMMQLATMNVIYNMMFVKRFAHGTPTARFLVNAMLTYIKSLDPMPNLFPFLRFTPKYRKLFNSYRPISEELKIFTEQIIEECLKDGNIGQNFVKLYAEQMGSEFDQSELYYIIKDLLLGGTETTATQLRWAFILLANNPGIQKRMQDEIDAAVPGDRLPSLDDRPKLPYVEAAILEVIRLRTILPMPIPRTTVNDTEVDGYFIPAKSQVFVNIHSAHMDPDVWPEPEEFRPERFLNGQGEVVNRELILAFSLGKRVCPGEVLARQEMFIFLCSLLQRFNILPPEGQTYISQVGATINVTAPLPHLIRFITRR